jgi:hypothetical protein
MLKKRLERLEDLQGKHITLVFECNYRSDSETARQKALESYSINGENLNNIKLTLAICNFAGLAKLGEYSTFDF